MAIDLTTMLADKYKNPGDRPSSFVTPNIGCRAVRVDATAQTLATTSDYAIFKMEAGQAVIGCAVHCLTAEGATATLDIGYYSAGANDQDAFETDAECNSAGSVDVTWNTTSTYTYTDDWYVTITANNEMDTAIFVVYIFYLDYNLAPTSYIDYDAAD